MPQGRDMHATIIAVADQLASAADLAGGKVAQLPVVVVRGYAAAQPTTTAARPTWSCPASRTSSHEEDLAGMKRS